MPFHVLGHVEADQLHPQHARQLARDLGLADAGRSGEQVGTDRLLRVTETGTGQLDGRSERGDGLVLAEHHQLEIAVEVTQRFTIGQ